MEEVISPEVTEPLVEESTEVMQEVVSVSLEQVEALLAQNNELLLRIYSVSLFVVGVCGALLVLFLLYKFLRKFF